MKDFKKNLKKKQVFLKKIAKIYDIKKLKNYSLANKNLSVTYYQNLRDVFWPLGLERPE